MATYHKLSLEPARKAGFFNKTFIIFAHLGIAT
jgi:hypothetical protein